jgi:hypothetical protein
MIDAKSALENTIPCCRHGCTEEVEDFHIGWQQTRDGRARLGEHTIRSRSNSMADPVKEQEYREEAERLAQLPSDVQRELIAQHRAIAADESVPQPDREEAAERAGALEMHLRRLARKRKEPL